MGDGGVKEVTQDSFEAEVLGSQGPVLAEFGTDWCAPCRRLKPLLQELAERSTNDAKIVTIDTDRCGELRDRYQISAIPTVLVFRDGEVVRKLIGVISKHELESALQQAVTA